MSDQVEILFATSNAGKIRDAKRALGESGIDLLSPQEWCDRHSELSMPDEVDETGSTYEENALLKAEALNRWASLPTLADDSGLEVEALNGEPGVFSARFAGEGCTFDDNINKLLTEMEGKQERKAKFISVICFKAQESSPLFFRGELEGVITKSRRGSGGFGYDPVFEVLGAGKTLAELKEGTEPFETHRTKALKSLFSYLQLKVPTQPAREKSC